MSLTSSSSSATCLLRSAVRSKRISISSNPSSLPRTIPLVLPRRTCSPARHYSPAPAYNTSSSPEEEYDGPSSRPYRQGQGQGQRQTSHSSFGFRPIQTTPESAQSYLTELFHLPPDRQIPPSLALQILTHKSFRNAKLLRHSPSPSPSPSPSTSSSSSSSHTHTLEQLASHNARLSFVGRRALATYFTMFLHSALAAVSSQRGLGLRDLDFLRGRSLQEKLDALRDAQNLGREVGNSWRVSDVMRWDQNPNTIASAANKIQGTTVEAIIGGIFTVYGSPAAHRAFHLHVLPHMTPQLRDPALIERAQTFQKNLLAEAGPAILGRDIVA